MDGTNDDWDENVSKGIEVFKEKSIKGVKMIQIGG